MSGDGEECYEVRIDDEWWKRWGGDQRDEEAWNGKRSERESLLMFHGDTGAWDIYIFFLGKGVLIRGWVDQTAEVCDGKRGEEKRREEKEDCRV